MSRNAKIGIGVVIGLVVACVFTCLGAVAVFTFAGDRLLEQIMVEDPEQVRHQAEQIVDYKLPPGFTESGAMNFFTGKMVFIEGNTSADEGAEVVILITELVSADMMDTQGFREQFQGQVQQAVQKQSVDWQLVDENPITLGGEETWVYTFEGEGDDGSLMRQLTTDIFNGKSGVVFLTIIGAQAEWPQEHVDDFLASIH